MRHRTLARISLLLLLLLTTLQLAARADDDKYADDDSYEETARVARVSLLSGDVSLRRAGSDKWERAALNSPLVEGDRITTGAASRVEIQIDSRNFVRVGENATVEIVTLRDEGVALSLPEGTATLRLARFDRDHEYFEIDAPGTTVAAQDPGLYRLDVDGGGRVRVAVRDGGRARLYSESSGFTLRDGRVAEMIKVGSSDEADWEFSDLKPFDDWDAWVDSRERYLLARLNYTDRDRYYDQQVYGAEELDSYGDWVQTADYGYVWRPRAAVVNIYNDWAPYRYGHWDWCPPYGWVWVGDEPWGWAPYHYGRWVYVDNYWCWAPRGYAGYRHRAWWRPALVAFVDVDFSFGRNVCWYPLPYHQRDPRSNFWRRVRDREELERRRREELAELQRMKDWRRAVSGLPAKDFSRGQRPKPADPELAKLALAREPLRGRLPVRPADGEGGEGNMRERLSADKRAVPGGGDTKTPNDPARDALSRKTGAARRLPGVALDDQLRRERMFDNRSPVNKGLKNEAGDPSRRSLWDAKGRKGDGNSERRADPSNASGNATDRRDSTTDRRDDLDRRIDTRDNREGDARTTGAVARPVRTRPDDGRERGGSDKSAGGKGGIEKSDGLKGGDKRADGDAAERRTIQGDRERAERERSNAREERNTQPPDRIERTEPRRERAEPRVERTEPRVERTEPRREERPAPQVERAAPREERPSPRNESRNESRSSGESKSSSSRGEDRHSDSSKSEGSRGRPPREK